ncbi:MAG: hypothetical protein SVY41_03220 [Candidatus Nanohaloarchaea archaeon]|nr:hypothetical protein [Candidatus Nanohaloarchaea archaeon]
MYCDTCGTLLPMDIKEYGKLADNNQAVECGSCRHTPEQATDLLAEVSRRQTVQA